MLAEFLYAYSITAVTIIIAAGMALAFWYSGGKWLLYYLQHQHPILGGALVFTLFTIVLLIARYFSPAGIRASYVLVAVVVALGIAFLYALAFGLWLKTVNPHRLRPSTERLAPNGNHAKNEGHDAGLEADGAQVEPRQGNRE